MTPQSSSARVLRMMAQELQSALDTTPDAPLLPLQRDWVARWQTVLLDIVAVLDDPLDRSALLLGFAVGVAFGGGFALCWVLHR
jgi:hypothetical protein